MRVANVRYHDGWNKMHFLNAPLRDGQLAHSIATIDSMWPELRLVSEASHRSSSRSRLAQDWKAVIQKAVPIVSPIISTVWPGVGTLIGAGLTFAASQPRLKPGYKDATGVVEFSRKKKPAVAMVTRKAQRGARARQAEEVSALQEEMAEMRAAQTEEEFARLEERLAEAESGYSGYEGIDPIAVTFMPVGTDPMESVTVELGGPLSNVLAPEELEYVSDQFMVRDYNEALRTLNDNDAINGPLFDALASFDGCEIARGKRESDTPCCSACAQDAEWYGLLPTGTFFKSGLISASLVNSLEEGVYGMVDLGASFPVPVSISAKHGGARARISAAHELAHVGNALYKWGLPHTAVHELGVYYATEALPALQALEATLEHSQE